MPKGRIGYKPDLVLMPIGGHFVMDPKDAALGQTSTKVFPINPGDKL